MRAVNQKKEKRRDRDDCGSNNHFVEVGSGNQPDPSYGETNRQEDGQAKGKGLAFRGCGAVSSAYFRVRSGGKVLRKIVDDVVRGLTSFARGMSESAGAGVVLPVENHIVVVIRAGTHRHGVEMQIVTNLPGNDVIGARGIAAQAEAADDFAIRRIERKPPPKTIIPPIALPTMGSFGVPKVAGSPNTAFGFGGALVARL